MKASFLSLTLLAIVSVMIVDAFGCQRSTLMMKRGRGSFAKKKGAKSGGMGSRSVEPMGSGVSSNNAWYPVSGVSSAGDLPNEEGKVQLVDTMVKKLINGATNPTGAVGVAKHEGSVYCFSASCSSCKIPLNKAKVLGPSEETGSDPRIMCDFCSATYNLRTGERVASAGGNGLIGGIVKGLFSKKEEAPLDVYALGEKDGSVVINVS